VKYCFRAAFLAVFDDPMDILRVASVLYINYKLTVS
jgi:hypothetical protein